MSRRGAVTLDQEIKRIPLVQRALHGKIHSQEATVLKAMAKFLFVFVPPEWSADKNDVREDFWVYGLPVNTARKRRHKGNIVGNRSNFQPLTNEITCDQVPGCGVTILKTEPPCYKSFH